MIARKLSWSALLVCCLCVVLLSTILAQAEPLAGRKPNIVIILADDLGYGDVSCYNPDSKIATPHIDQLAKEGLRFTDAHSASGTCTPSRYGLLTGINPARTGVKNTSLATGRPIIDKDEATLARLLRDQGYRTEMIGKWHLGFENKKQGRTVSFDFSKPLAGGPLDHGFDSFFGIPSSPGASPLFYIRDRSVVALPTETATVIKQREGEKTLAVKVMRAPGYKPEDASSGFCRAAVELIHAHAALEAATPLFLYYASPVPHQPWAPSSAFKGKSTLGDYGDVIMQLDDVVGQINRALKETGLDKNTLLIFTSDNGPGPWAVAAMAALGHASSGPLRGRKSDAWEGGHRVPFMITWPGQIAPERQTNSIINFTDIFATLGELLQIDLAEAYPSSAADSHSFLPVLLDSAKHHRRPPMVNGRHAIREGKWKLVSRHRHEDAGSVSLAQFELYNLADDLAEENDVSESHPERAQRLFADFTTFAKNRKLKSKD
ncbi:MAG TPA: arylsulfatase [Lentisphaeria bacterium]|nr:arylsulfatase [Lentisphaeria bacterium]